MELTSSFALLLQHFLPVFTAPTFQTFVEVVTGWVLSPRRRFVTEVIFSGGNVDNAKAAHAEADIALRKNAVVVWTAMGHDVAHPPQDDRVDMSVLAELEYSRDAAHNLIFSTPA